MIAAFDIAIRASVVVGLSLIGAAALRRRSASLRHSIIAAGLFSAVVVAPLGWALPSWDVPVEWSAAHENVAASTASRPPAEHDTVVATARTPATPAAAPVDLAPIANAVWAIGFVVAIAPMLWSFVRLARLTRRSTVVNRMRLALSAVEGKDVVLLKTDVPGLVGTFGWRRPRVLLPTDCESWSGDLMRVVIGHELAHIKRGDWLIQTGADVVRAVFWYNPLFWIAAARLRRESEQACDDSVLDSGVAAADYAAHLLDLARACRPLGGAVVPIARPSTLEWRIAAMLNHTLARRRPTRQALALVFVVIVGVTLATASFRAATPAQPAPLTGVVYDPTGAVMPAVSMTLDGPAGLHQVVQTDRNGRFDFGVISPGKYSLASSLAGFSSLTQDVTLEKAGDWNRPITLQVGTLSETVTVSDRRPATATPPSARVMAIGGNIRAPRKLVSVNPVYPAAMRDAGLEGSVPLGAQIGTDGSVISVRLLSASAHPEFVKPAIDAVRQWKFSPTLLNGEPVEVFMSVTVKFFLEN